MAVNVGGIYFSVEAETKNATLNIKNIQESIKLMADNGAANLSKLTNAFKPVESASNKLNETFNKNAKYTTQTLSGLENRLGRLQAALSKSQIGSDGFNKLSAAIQDTKNKMESAGQSSSKLQGLLSSLGQAGFSSMSLLSAGIKGAALALAGMVASKAFTLGVDFEKQMSEVGAATNATKAQFGELEKAARKLGATTSFSATQAAQAMTELGKAGLTTNQVLVGTNAVLNLAKAGSLGLAEAATIAADTMAGFGLQAEDMSMISDVLAKSANSSTIGVQELGETFKYVSGVAKGAGIGIQQIAAATSILGNAGIKGSMAGTALKSVILNLSAPSTEGSKALNRLGLSMSSLQDKQGNLKELPEIFALLNSKASQFSSTQKADIFKDLFGMESLSGALALMDKAEMSFNSMTGKMESDFTKMVDVMTNQSKGFAKQYGDALSNNVSGQLDNLSSAIEEFFLVVYDPIKPILSVLITLTNTIVTMGTNVLKFLLKPFKDLFDFLQPALLQIVKYFDSFGNTITDLSFLFDDFYAAIMQIPEAIFKTADAFDSMVNEIIALFQPLTNQVTVFFNSFGESESIWDSIIEGNKQIGEAVQKVVNWFKENVTVLNVIKASLAPIVVTINIIVAAVRLFVAAWDLTLKAIDAVSRRLQPMRDLVSTIVKGIKDLITGNISLNIDLPNFTETLKNAFDLNAIYNYFQKGFAEIWNDIKKMATQFWESFKTISKNAINAIKDFFKNDKTLEKELEKKEPTIKAKLKIEKVEMPKQSTSSSSSNEPSSTGASSSGRDFGSMAGQFSNIRESVGLLFGDIEKFKKAAQPTAEKWKNAGNAINSALSAVQESMQMIGGMIINFMNSKAQLAAAQFENLKQKLTFIGQYADKMNEDNLKNTLDILNAETNIQVKKFDDEIAVIENQNAALLEEEKAFQAEMKALKFQMDEESRQEAERRFEEIWALREQDYENQLAFIEANTADETERAISQETLLNEKEQEKIALRQTINEQLSAEMETNAQTIAQKEEAFAAQKAIKEDEISKKKAAVEQQKTAFLAEQENKRTQAQDAADKKRLENQKNIKLIEWVMGKNAFELDKQAKLAQAKMQMAMGVMDVTRAAFSMPPITLPLLSFIPLVLQTGMNSIAAIGMSQYPPPPMFAKGGIVQGNSFTGDSINARVNSGEMILTETQQKNLFEMANTGKPTSGGVTNVYYAGVQIGTIQSNNPDEIYRMVEPRIRQEIYQAVTR